MLLPSLSAGLRRHLFPDELYGETPKLSLADKDRAASNVARLMVKLGIDGRGPQSGPALPPRSLPAFCA